MLFNIILSVLITFVLVAITESSISKIDPELNIILKNGDRVNVFITFDEGIQPALKRTVDIRKNTKIGWAQRKQEVVNALKSTSDESQRNVANILTARASRKENFKYFKQFWSSNIIFVKDANIDIIQEIAQDSKVKLIKKEPIATIPDVTPEKDEKSDLKSEGEFKNWGLSKIQVQEAWAEVGNQGDGVVVGTIDTGVHHTHEALRDNFVGSAYGWFNPFNNSNEPLSHQKHGTHTLGTLAGSKGIGVAPGSKWMTCVACNSTHCPGETLLACMEFMGCPTLPDGSNPDCTRAPRVVSNSWGFDHGVTEFNDPVLAWRALGIIPVFSIGNWGFRCRRTIAPGELPWVIGVGSTDTKDRHFIRSSVGPAASGIIKPDIAAPGFNILSASDESDTSYDHLTGTSMACPHVAGVVALLLARDPGATYEEIFELITSTANPNVTLNRSYLDEYCPEGSVDLLPNIYFGYGRVDALKAVQAQTKLLKKKI